MTQKSQEDERERENCKKGGVIVTGVPSSACRMGAELVVSPSTRYSLGK